MYFMKYRQANLFLLTLKVISFVGCNSHSSDHPLARFIYPVKLIHIRYLAQNVWQLIACSLEAAASVK